MDDEEAGVVVGRDRHDHAGRDAQREPELALSPALSVEGKGFTAEVRPLERSETEHLTQS